jgi:hypothetical protein
MSGLVLRTFFHRRITIGQWLIVALITSWTLFLTSFATAQNVVFTVNSTGDGGDVLPGDGLCADATGNCTLRAAIQEGNSGSGTDKIEFSLTTRDPNYDGTKWTIPLTISLPAIAVDLTITGPGQDKLVVAATGGLGYRIFNLLTLNFTMSGLTISGGDAVKGNGGALQNPVSAVVRIFDCTFSGNHAASGGAIANLANGTVYLTDCTFMGNGAISGGAIYNDHGTLNITNCTVSGNTVSTSGGGLFCYTGSVNNIFNSVFSANSAEGGGGVESLGTLSISTSTFDGNTGGGIGSGGSLMLSLSTVSNNIGTGVGVSSGNIIGCTISGNSAAGPGGGISTTGSINVINSTVAYNSASSENVMEGGGGGIFASAMLGDTVYLSNCTIAFNSTVPGTNAFGGGINNWAFSSQPLFIKNCIVALNTSEAGPDVSGNFASSSNLTSEGFNLIGKTDGGVGFTAATDLTGTIAAPLDPRLDPNGLQDNGGPTQTIALLVGSPAIDHATAVSPTGTLMTDQRDMGFARTFDQSLIPNGADSDGTDIGAFELDKPIASSFANISTRDRVETGDTVLIGGFIISGTDPKKVLLRAIGPSLPLSGFLADPTLELHDQTGKLVGTNDNWQTNLNAQEIIDTGIPPTNALESALLVTLDPGPYTAIVMGSNDSTGIALVEAYDLDETVDSRLANVSTRGLVQTGDDVMIGGVILEGTESKEVLLRAIGPSLPLNGTLADPVLELHDKNGAMIATNDNWRTDQEAEIEATGLPPENDADSAILMTLAPDAYTAIVRGQNNATGIALVEAYALGN